MTKTQFSKIEIVHVNSYVCYLIEMFRLILHLFH